MTSRERVMSALAHREPDRTPLFEYVLQPPVADHILGHPYAYGTRWEDLVKEQGWPAALRQQAADIVDLARRLGHDLLYVVPVWPPAPPAAPVSSPRPACDDPVAEMAWRVRQTEARRGAALPDEPFLIYRLVREELARQGLDLPILAPGYGHGVWTDTVLMQAMVLAPELVHRHYALATEGVLQQVEKYLNLGIELIGVGGDFAGNRGPLISPACYRAFIVPEVRRVARRVRAAGCFSVNASDGDLWPVLDDFLIGCEVDGYIEIDLRAGMDLAALKERYGARSTFFGNLDCANLMSFGTPAKVREHTRDCLRRGWGQGGHMLCCNNAITGSVPVANYLAIGDAYREFFGL